MAKVKVVKSENDNKSNPVWGFIVGILIVATITSIIVAIKDDTESSGASLQEYVFRDTDGYQLNIYKDSCYLSKNGSKLNNVCTFKTNAGGSGVSKLTICDAFSSGCESVDLENMPKRKYIYIYGHEFYRQ